jgi:hypothetical protein
VQVPLKLPCPVGVKVTVPPGFDAPVPAVSVTVTDTVLDTPTVTEVGFSATITDVDRAETLITVLIAPVKPLLEAVRV